jgi:trans-2,3-dihydro-3-hydroxyanthranilate isomerase
MKYQYYTCDVFAQTRFGGNPLAVLPKAAGLTDRQMQQIAREFNCSETAFVFPPEAGHTRRVRIFTPAREVPFAGHPNVGTAFVLATTGELGDLRSVSGVTFEEKAGLVPLSIHTANDQVVSCELRAPQSVSFGETISAQLIASAVSLTEGDILTKAHEPQVVSVGLPFVLAELRDRSALERCHVNMIGFADILALLKDGVRASVYLYTRTTDDVDICARMFAPLSGVPEDPATGSATCAIVGLLAHLDQQASGEFTYELAQGVEMGRPSRLRARAEKTNGVVTATWVGGSCVMVSEGFILVD